MWRVGENIRQKQNSSLPTQIMESQSPDTQDSSVAHEALLAHIRKQGELIDALNVKVCGLFGGGAFVIVEPPRPSS